MTDNRRERGREGGRRALNKTVLHTSTLGPHMGKGGAGWGGGGVSQKGLVRVETTLFF